MVKSLDLPGVPPVPEAPAVPADDAFRRLVLSRRASAMKSLDAVNSELDMLGKVDGFDLRKKYLRKRQIDFSGAILACDNVLKDFK